MTTMENGMDINNEKRLIAAQIIRDLYENNQKEQLELLEIQVCGSLEFLEKGDQSVLDEAEDL